MLSRRRSVGVVLLVITSLGIAVPVGLRSTGQIHVSGLRPGAAVTAAAARSLRLSVSASVTRVRIDGRPVAVRRHGGRITVTPGTLPDGPHRLELTTGRGLLARRRTIGFTVDSIPPAIDVSRPRPAHLGKPVTLAGTLTGASRLSIDGRPVAITSGAFSATFPSPPAGSRILAVDPAGNRTEITVTVPVAYPDNIRAVHMTALAWAYRPLRDPVIKLIRSRRINAVQLDIKDEEGVIGYPSTVPTARLVGATSRAYDLAQTVNTIHRLGARIIGRIVAFNDPKYADYAWSHGKRDQVIQNPDGTKYLYGYARSGFTNFASPAVRRYNEDLAAEAAAAGFDDVVYDYVRRPDGPLAKMRFPGLRGRPEDAIVSFLAETQARIRPLGAGLGAAAFAQAATRPRSTAQDIPKMARYLDVVIPMDYPSHWNPGEYGVPDPYADPYSIVYRSLRDWRRAVRGTSCKVVPWLQDENYKGVYTPDKVRAQIRATRDNRIPGWLMWSAGARYQGAAYSTDATPAR